MKSFQKFAPKFAALAAMAALFVASDANAQSRAQYESMVATHAAANNVPEALVHRVIVRESKYHPDLVGRGGTIGLMQIKLATARGLGYTGNAQGLLDANTNLTYAVKYLAGAYRAAHGNHNLAVRYYAGGYYYAAKAQGWNANAQRVGDGGSLIPAVLTQAPANAASAPPAKPEIVTDAAHRKVDGNPFLFTLKQEPPGAQAKRGAETNPFAGLFQPAPQKQRRGRSSRGHS
jgi:soluble lytic murein transglycosylase-like protein